MSILKKYINKIISLKKLSFFEKKDSNEKLSILKQAEPTISLNLTDKKSEGQSYLVDTNRNIDTTNDPNLINIKIQSNLDRFFQDFRSPHISENGKKDLINSDKFKITETILNKPLFYFNEKRMKDFGKDSENISLIF